VTASRIAAIIPTLNEAPRIGGLVAALRAQDPAMEIVVADGGSVDGTPAAARAAGARVVAAPRGRGQQLAAGVAQSAGEIVWFVHADTAIPRDAVAAIRYALRDPATIGGNFAVAFDGDANFDRWLTGFYGWFRRRGLYYGDSAVFVRRAALVRIGGIRPIALMEDFDLTRRMERTRATVCIEAPAIATSSRRFAGRHPASIVVGWMLIHALWYLRFPPRLLARIYRSAVHSPLRRAELPARGAEFKDQS
jgi:glycosyltransferase involved in cell wall biosynthesis